MKKLLIYTLLYLLSIMFTDAQSIKSYHILLSNYTYTSENNLIGTIILKDSKSSGKFVLKGENAKAFKINSDNQLLIKSKYSRTHAKWYDLIIETELSGIRFRDSFRIVKDEFIRNKVIAHRGAWKNTGAPENSIASLQNAIKLGCQGSEFDVRFSSDGVPFIHHDPHIGDLLIEKTTATQLSTIKLTNGEALPTLINYLQEGMKQNTTKLILEIKPPVNLETALSSTEKVVRLVQQSKAQAWVDYISFDYDMCKKIIELNPYAKVSYLNGDKSPEELARDKFYGLDYHFSVFQKQTSWIKDANERKLTINVWTIDKPELMDLFLKQDADFITTNEPELLLQKLDKKK